MVGNISDFLSSLDFQSLILLLFNNNYYSILFPFLLAFALFFTVLSNLNIFKSKKTKKPYKSVITVISLIISFYGVTFETSQGHNVGELLSVLFPNISTITIAILSLYIVGAILGKNFFKGIFRKDHSAYIYMTFGVIGFGACIYYVGIAMGFWNYNYYDLGSYWNTVIAITMLIVGIVFLFVDLIPIGILFLIIFGLFVANSGNDSILSYFIDPVVFIIFIVIILLSWLNSDKDKKQKLANSLNDREDSSYFNKNLKDYDSRINDISDQNYKNNIKKWEKLYGKNDSWGNYK